MSLSEMKALENKVEAVNKLHDFMNRFIPLIQKRLEGFKITKDGCFFKKDDDIVKEVLQEMNKPSQIRCWYSINRYNIFWQFDITYEDKNGSKIYENQFYTFGNDLDEKTNERVWTANEYVPKRTDFTYEEVAKEIAWKVFKEEKIKEIQDEIDKHKHNYHPFLRG